MSDPEKDTDASPEEAPRGPVVLVQHLQRDAGSRHLRAARGGHRRQGVLLDDGSRIRQKAYRKTEMSVASLADNHQSILEHVRQGRIALFDSEENELSYDEVVKLLSASGVDVNEESLKEHIARVASPVPSPELDERSGEPKIMPAEEPSVPHEDETKPNIELSETIAAVDMAEERKKLPEQPQHREPPPAHHPHRKVKKER